MTPTPYPMKVTGVMISQLGPNETYMPSNVSEEFPSYAVYEMPADVRIIVTYVKPTTLILGILLNIFMFSLIVNTKLRKLAPMIYVAGVVLTDSGYLCFNVFVWVQEYFQCNILHTVGMCQLINYCMKAFTFLSRWYMAGFAMERLIWEFLPERRAELCNVFKTKLVLISIAVLAMYGHVYFCWYLEVSDDTNNVCSVAKEYLKTFNALLRLDMVVAYMLPYGLIIAISIVVVIRKIRCIRRRDNPEVQPRRTIGHRGRLQIVDNREDRVRHLHATGIFLCLTLSLILLTVPLNTNAFAGVMFSEFFISPTCTSILTMLKMCGDFYIATKPLLCFLVSPKIRHCAKRLIKRAVNRATVGKVAGPNSNSINLQEFNIEDSTDGTLIAIV